MFANINDSYGLQPVALAAVADETYDNALGLDEALRLAPANAVGCGRRLRIGSL